LVLVLKQHWAKCEYECSRLISAVVCSGRDDFIHVLLEQDLVASFIKLFETYRYHPQLLTLLNGLEALLQYGNRHLPADGENGMMLWLQHEPGMKYVHNAKVFVDKSEPRHFPNISKYCRVKRGP
jgi:hypothetical protein